MQLMGLIAPHINLQQLLKPQSQLKVDEVIVGRFQCLIVHKRIFGTQFEHSRQFAVDAQFR